MVIHPEGGSRAGGPLVLTRSCGECAEPAVFALLVCASHMEARTTCSHPEFNDGCCRLCGSLACDQCGGDKWRIADGCAVDCGRCEGTGVEL